MGLLRAAVTWLKAARERRLRRKLVRELERSAALLEADDYHRFARQLRALADDVQEPGAEREREVSGG